MHINKISFQLLAPLQSPLKTLIRNVKLNPLKQYVKQRSHHHKQPTTGNIYLQALGTGAVDQPSTAALIAPKCIYLFNCCENTGRYFYGNGVSPSRVEHIFITQPKWSFIGGFTAILFHVLARIGRFPQFHGPDTLFKITQRMTFLSVVGGLFKRTFTQENFNANDFMEDENVRVDFIQLTEQTMADACVVFAYFCKVKAKHGAFSLERSVAKNVPAGELLVKLFNGEDVTLPDGTLVTAAEVRFQSFPDKYFLILDVPSQNYLPDLDGNERIKELLNQIEPDALELVVHFTPHSVYETQRYQEIISKFNAKRHSIMNDSNQHSALPNVHRMQRDLHSIDPKVHPLLSLPPNPTPITYDPTEEDCDKCNQAPQLLTKYIFQQMTDKKSISSDIFEDEMHEEAANDIKKSENKRLDIFTRPESVNRLNDETFPRFIFLGTGSGSSMYNRNASGVLVHISKSQSILLDCGEGICSQIHRFYGDQAPLVFRRIKAVFVSHMHLDHHIGLPELFRMRALHLPVIRPPLLLFCPVGNLKSWLHFYSNHVEYIYPDMKLISNSHLSENGLNPKLCRFLGIGSLRTCMVPHNDNSSAITLDIPIQQKWMEANFKLTYSGDTEPSDDLVELAKNSTLFIHEATFQDELEEMAAEKRHSTISQAITQAQRSNAMYTILTHFSGRYDRIPCINGHLPGNVGIAFDNMEVTVDDLPRLNGLLAKYQQVFCDDIEQLELKTQKYKQQFEPPKVIA